MKLPCSIIEDILPLYADNICSEESRQAVDEHCADCMDCSEKLRAMKAVLPESKLEGKPVNPVRKIAAHYVRLSAVTILGCMIVFSLIFLRMNGDISEKITAKSCERAMNDFALHLEKQEYTEAFKDMDFLCYWKENPADEFDYSEEELELVRGDFAKLFEDFLSMYPATSHSVSTDKRYYGLVGLLDVDFYIPGNARHIIRFEFFYYENRLKFRFCNYETPDSPYNWQRREQIFSELHLPGKLFCEEFDSCIRSGDFYREYYNIADYLYTEKYFQLQDENIMLTEAGSAGNHSEEWYEKAVKEHENKYAEYKRAIDEKAEKLFGGDYSYCGISDTVPRYLNEPVGAYPNYQSRQFIQHICITMAKNNGEEFTVEFDASRWRASIYLPVKNIVYSDNTPEDFRVMFEDLFCEE